jgi:hypothetical protein
VIVQFQVAAAGRVPEQQEKQLATPARKLGTSASGAAKKILSEANHAEESLGILGALSFRGRT